MKRITAGPKGKIDVADFIRNSKRPFTQASSTVVIHGHHAVKPHWSLIKNGTKRFGSCVESLIGIIIKRVYKYLVLTSPNCKVAIECLLTKTGISTCKKARSHDILCVASDG